MTASSSVWATLTINGIFFVGLMFLFERYRTKVLDIYAPKSRGANPKADKPRPGYFEWVKQLYEINDEQMFNIAGMDGYVFLRFVYFCCKLTSVTGICGALILIPVYSTGPGMGYVNDLDKASMGNIEQDGVRLWVPFIFVYLFTITFLVLIHWEYENFVTMRTKFFHGEVDIIPLQTQYTVQVENIPREYRTSEKLFELFESMFPGEVMYARVVLHTPDLDKVIAERNSVRDQLERAIAAYEANGRTARPMLDLRKFRPSLYVSTENVDSITFLTKHLNQLCHKAARMQRESLMNDESSHHASVISSSGSSSHGGGFSLRSPPVPPSSSGSGGGALGDDSLYPDKTARTSGSKATSDVRASAAASAGSRQLFQSLSNAAAGASAGAGGGGIGRRSMPTIELIHGAAVASPRRILGATALAPTAPTAPATVRDTDFPDSGTSLHPSTAAPAGAGSLVPTSGREEADETCGGEDVSADDAEDDADASFLRVGMLHTYNPMTALHPAGKHITNLISSVKHHISEHFLTTTGFVTFRTRRAHWIAVKSTVLFERYPHMVTHAAPPPVDVIWQNLTASSLMTEETAFLSAAAYYGSLAFWGGVMAFVAAMSTLPTLQKYFPALQHLNYMVYATLQGILPVIVVLSFSTIVSGVIAFVARNVEKRKTNSAVEREVFKWYFMYQIANIYLILVAGSVWGSLVHAIERPTKIVSCFIVVVLCYFCSLLYLYVSLLLKGWLLVVHRCVYV
jgi:hypothetical protein